MKNILFILIVLTNFNNFAVAQDEDDIFGKAWKGVKTGAQRPFFTFPPELTMLAKQVEPEAPYRKIFKNLREDGLSRKIGGVFSHHIAGMFLKSFYTYALVATVPKITKDLLPELSREQPLVPWAILGLTIAGADTFTLPFFEGMKVKYLTPQEAPKNIMDSVKRACGFYKTAGMLTGQISFWNAMVFFKFNMEMQSYLKNYHFNEPLPPLEQVAAAIVSSGLQAALTVPLINERTVRLANKNQPSGFLSYTLSCLKRGDISAIYKGGLPKWAQLFLIGWFNLYAVNKLAK